MEIDTKKTEAAFRPPPLPEPEHLPDLLHRWRLSKGEELFFIQLPDSLPGQPPTKEHKPVKTEVQSQDGQSVLLKTDPQVNLSVLCLDAKVQKSYININGNLFGKTGGGK